MIKFVVEDSSGKVGQQFVNEPPFFKDVIREWEMKCAIQFLVPVPVELESLPQTITRNYAMGIYKPQKLA